MAYIGLSGCRGGRQSAPQPWAMRRPSQLWAGPPIPGESRSGSRPVPHLSPVRRWSPGGVGDEDLAVVHTSLGEDRLEVVLDGVG